MELSIMVMNMKATYHKTVDGIVVLSGVVRSKEYGVIAQLPEGYRPSEKLVFNVNSHSTPARVDILVDGRIMWVNGEIRHCHGHISLGNKFSRWHWKRNTSHKWMGCME